LIETEQGLGDTIQFVRYASEIKRLHQGQVIVACEPPLVPLLRQAPGIDVLIAQDQPRPPFDVWTPLLSLPGIFQHSFSTVPARIPYLRAEPDRVARWKTRLASSAGLKSASPGRETKRTRRIRTAVFP